LPWFRRKRKDDTRDTVPTAVAETPPDAALEQVDAADAGATETELDDDAATPAKRKRRRGTRGGRGRKKPASAAADGGGEVAALPATAPERANGQPAAKRTRKERDKERSSGRSSSRRRQQPRRAPLPAAKRELLISVDVGEQRVAVIEDDRVAEVYLERPERRSIAGNIYLGTVDNVLPGMEAAFVEIGLEKNGFLYVDEIVVPELEGKRHGKKIQDLISRGEQLLVQAVKDPMKTKGARLTTEISLPGRFLVFVPNGEGLGVSRRLEDAERQRLKDILKDLDAKGGGVIVRTAAEGASAEDIERDLVFLQRLWGTTQARAKSATAPALVYQEAELPLRIVRDLFAGDFVSATIDHERTFKRIVGYLKKTSPHMIERVHRYKERTPLFEAHGVEREIQSTLDRRVDLPSGGYLIFDYAEAFTVVDVNTGRFVGSRSKTSSQRLEDTITKNNLEAVKEVVRQLRLRDIGGIIVIDFIDMANPKNRSQVEEALRTELERDRTKTYVVEISPLGLVEMTRQNVTDGPREILTRKCPVCAGDGIVVSDTTIAMQIERRLRALATPGSRVQAYRVAVHPRILGLLAGPAGERLAAIEESVKRRFFLVPAENGHIHNDYFEVLAEGRLEELRPPAPFAEGDELELKLVELGLHDSGAAVGKADGMDVVVAGAAKLVGKKPRIVIGRVLDGQAFASLAGDAPTEGPITFESEAEKPTRAPSRRKAVTAPEEDGPAVADEAASPVAAEAEQDAEDEFEAVADELADEEEAELEAADGAATPAKKRTRRGSRGGRKRKRKPAETVDGEAGEAQVDADAVADDTAPGATHDARAPDAEAGAKQPAAPRPRSRRRTPKIHVPAPDLESADENGSAPLTTPAEEVAALVADREDGGEAVAVEEGEAAPAKKRTRRGSRGGRGRRKKPATVAAGEGGTGAAGVADGDGPAHEVEEAAQASAEERRPDGYVPMSEWLDDFDA
jgi:ribonuclease G